MAAAAAAPPNEALALLAALTAKLHSPTYRPSVSDSKRRASVALLLRVRAPPGSSSSTNADERGNSTLPTIGAGSARLLDLPRCFETPWIRDGTLELLYIKRAVHVGDRWSGQVAFPGGKQEAGESDQQTAEREVVEEIGLHLNDSSKFLYIGRLDDERVFGVRGEPLLAVCSFVYLQLIPETPLLRLHPGEVADIRWVPLQYFIDTKHAPELSHIRYTMRDYSPAFGHMFNISPMIFPSVHLPVPSNVADYASSFYIDHSNTKHARPATPSSPVIDADDESQSRTPLHSEPRPSESPSLSSSSAAAQPSSSSPSTTPSTTSVVPPPRLPQAQCMYRNSTAHEDCWPLWGVSFYITLKLLEAGKRPQPWNDPPFHTASRLANALLLLQRNKCGAAAMATAGAVGTVLLWYLLPPQAATAAAAQVAQPALVIPPISRL